MDEENTVILNLHGYTMSDQLLSNFLILKILGKEYENDMFVGDFHNGNIYHFDLTDNRTALELDGPLKDKIANNQDELEDSPIWTRFWWNY